MRLSKIFNAAIPLLERRSLSNTHNESVSSHHQEVPESAILLHKNSDLLREDLHYLNSLLVISRNMLAIKETAQEICAAVGFDKHDKRLMELCVAVTSKGYDGENVPEAERGKLLEVTELCRSHYLCFSLLLIAGR
jgi:palmitoyltransferase